MRAARLCLLAAVVPFLTSSPGSAQLPKTLVAPGAAADQVLVADGLAPMQNFDDAYGLGRRADAGFVIAAHKGLTRWMWYNGFLPPAVRIEFAATLVSGPTNMGFGLAFGRASRDASQWMAFQVAGDGHYRLAGYGGTAAVPWRLSPAVLRGVGVRNRLAVEIRGRSLALFVNGVAVDSFVADRDVGGAVAAELSTGVEARYDDLRVIALAPGSAPIVVPPTTAVTVAPIPAAPAAADVVEYRDLPVSDDFTQTPLEDDQLGRTEYALGGQLTTARQPLVNFNTHWEFPSHIRIRLTVTLRAGALDGLAGFAFGRPSPEVDDFLTFKVSADGAWQLEGYDGVMLQPRTVSPAVRTGYNVANELRVDVQGRQLSAYVNGIRVGSFTSAQEIHGYLGTSTPAGHQVLFQHLRVEQLP